MAGRDDRDIRGDVRGQIREFLSTRRARISPGQAGLPVYGGDRRRVPGLLWTDPGPPRAQELPDLTADVATDVAVVVPACHVFHCTSASAGLGVPASTPLISVSHLPPLAGSVDSAPPMTRCPQQIKTTRRTVSYTHLTLPTILRV